MTQQSVDLNSDIGESFGAYTIGADEPILDVITSANIACGFHAGDYQVMAKTVQTAKDKRVAVGAHPGLPDLMGFGRRRMQVDTDEVYHFTLYQVGALLAFCKSSGVQMQHVKAHGALYHMAGEDAQLADAIANAVYDVDPDLILYGLSGSELLQAGEHYGLQTASEVFADRTYQLDGTLTPRSQENALITDTDSAVRQVLDMLEYGKVRATDGSEVEIQVDTICVHGDNVKALDFVKKLRGQLTKEGINIQCTEKKSTK